MLHCVGKKGQRFWYGTLCRPCIILAQITRFVEGD